MMAKKYECYFNANTLLIMLCHIKLIYKTLNIESLFDINQTSLMYKGQSQFLSNNNNNNNNEAFIEHKIDDSILLCA